MVKMIRPRPIRSEDIQKAVDSALRAADAELLAGYMLTYWSWASENQPEWKVVGPMTKKGNRVLRRETSSTPFVYVDLGTAGPYLIPKNPGAKMLTFQSGFIPKTVPGRLAAGPGARFGGWVSKEQVTHPGIEPRRFSEKLAESLEDSLPNYMSHYLAGV